MAIIPLTTYGNPIGFPKLQTSFINPDGSISQPWYQFLRNLWLRIGGATGPNSVDIASTALAALAALAVAQGRIAELEKKQTPIGGVIGYSGLLADILPPWALCDGTNGTPDLRDRFIIGAGGTHAVGDVGGSASVTLTVAEMPAHNHPVNDPGHFHSGGTVAANLAGATAGGLTGGDTGVATTGISIGDTGGGAPIDITPPYYALAFIMRVA